MIIDEKRIDCLRQSIREGEARLTLNKQTGKNAVRKAITSAKIRIERLKNLLPEGGMIWNGDRWVYEHYESNE